VFCLRRGGVDAFPPIIKINFKSFQVEYWQIARENDVRHCILVPLGQSQVFEVGNNLFPDQKLVLYHCCIINTAIASYLGILIFDCL
jgi:hypothetical protein